MHNAVSACSEDPRFSPVEAWEVARLTISVDVLGENDAPEDMEAQAKCIFDLRPSIPLHITRLFSRYQMLDKEATEVEQLYRLAGITGKYLAEDRRLHGADEGLMYKAIFVNVIREN